MGQKYLLIPVPNNDKIDKHLSHLKSLHVKTFSTLNGMEIYTSRRDNINSIFYSL